jgi:hypothetical protein
VNGLLSGVREWLFPASVRHAYIPPFEGGLRPNDLLEMAEPLLPEGDWAPDDVTVTDDSRIWFTSGTGLWRVEGGKPREIARFDDVAGAIQAQGNDVVVAVEHLGIVRASGAGVIGEVCTDVQVQKCITDITTVPDGFVATVGSSSLGGAQWTRALATRDRSGKIIRVAGGEAHVAATGLAWPSGVARDGDGVILSLSLDHRIVRRLLSDLSGPDTVIESNLPVYPGRIHNAGETFWVAAPYARNAATEFILEEESLCRDMVQSLQPSEWLVPQLRRENPYREALQSGQLRVMGVIKPWAPPKSYGLAFELSTSRGVTRSFHSRADGVVHGVTGVFARGKVAIATSRGRANLVELGIDLA